MAKRQKDPEHHDTAILLTRKNLCRRPGKCETLGLAELGTMCSPGRSCSLAEDSGLATAYTIAHELGHVFSLPHDGDGNRCTRSRGEQRLMAPSLSFETKPWSWSNCSRDKITQFLEMGYGSCLADKPSEKADYKYNQKLPGEVYSVNQQCKMVFGENSSLCPFMEPCRRLWCVTTTNDGKVCSTQHVPWADGTPCAKRRWCIRGHCVKRRRIKPVDGHWGQWGPYQECSRKCGGGISFSYRECNKPLPENGGKYCIGKRKRLKSCNTQECTKDLRDFRAIQCAHIHARSVSSGFKSYRSTHWLPKYAGISKQNQCKLYCRMAGTAIYFKLKDKVIDGTPCNPETTDICVDGKCMSAGCDRVLNSNKRTDKCGVCDGDNSSCRRFSGTFNETKFGYNYIFTIPVNSTDIVITQYGWKNREDSNYLALQSSGGKFLLNGGMIIGLGVREFRAAGSKIWYSGSEKIIEQIKIKGRVTEPIKVYVLEVKDVLPPNIHYSLNKMVIEPKMFVYKWDRLGRWTQCSKLCQGIRKRKPRCVRAIDGQLVSNSRCDQSTRPRTATEDCNISCQLRWQIENPGRCSARCGPGYQSRVVKCVRVHSDRWGEVLDKHCPGRTKPPLFVRCNGTCEGTKWAYSDWSKCSKSCNAGKQTRLADCVDNFGEILRERDCRPSDKQRLRRPCNTFACPHWTTENWSSCSATCGSGLQTRVVKCRGEQGEVDESLCKQRMPVVTQPCKLQACPYWVAGDWSDCSSTCGNGTMTRQVMCLSPGESPGEVARPLKEEKCSAATRPQSRKVCKTQGCSKLYQIHHGEGPLDDYYWRLKMWTPCSMSCGEKNGTQYRDVHCVLVRSGKQEVVDENYCAHTPKPADMNECHVLPCTSWRHGSWGRCSRPCGRGVQLRVVKCTYENFKITEDKNCKLKKPLSRRPCEVRECIPTSVVPSTTPVPTTLRPAPSWKTGAWGQCSVTCGQGQRQREVHCRYEDGKPSNECDKSNRPQSIMDCVLGACPKWHAEAWDECSVSCGEGIRRRGVSCRLPSGHLSPGCNKGNKPETREACNIRPCPRWMTGDWGKCSVTCGSGVKVRSVECSDKDFSCDARTKPQTTTQCSLKQCPEWKTSPWEECSVSCGQGQRRREVHCRYEDGRSSNKCDESNRPQSIMDCVLGACPEWHEEPWDECSVSCGDGFRQRRVSCRLQNGWISPGCSEQSKPATREACNIRPCPVWIIGEWGKCSVTCGSGIKVRPVECSDKDFSCDARTKPQNTTQCNLKPCPEWKTSPWGQCSVSCGSGNRRRSVSCRLQNGQLSPGCNEENKPAAREECNIRTCPTWITGDWGKCSVTCGSGFKLRVVDCSDKDFSCDEKTRPQTTAQCNLEPCPEWKTNSWGECSVSCGDGVRLREVYCRLRNGQLSHGCDQKTKPDSKGACNKRSCPTWMTGDWGECSVTCGLGVKRRSVECSDKAVSCDGRTKPQATAQCNLKTCPQWKTSPWEECSVSCGNGLRRRSVRCHGDSRTCDYRSRPKNVERCNPGTCPTWKTGEWRRCSKTCGNGVKTRSVNCHGLNSQCDVKTKPVTTARCYLRPCAEWKVGDWQQCTVTCGRGWRRRSVECTTRRLLCDYRTKPDMYAMCDMGKCPVWRAGFWSECSVSCGEGVRKRDVECTGGDGKCNLRIKPKSTTSCNYASCPQWEAGQWSQCSVSCGKGVKSRTVQCSGSRGKCDVKTKPQSTSSCNLGSCPVWKVGGWGQCSVTCGDGFKKREITCSRLDVSCVSGEKPQSISSCNLGSCPQWNVGEWGKCSVTCGSGKKQRTVTCSRSDVACDAANKPPSTAKCDLSACPKWETGDWGQCSVTCGTGVRTRAVRCSAALNKCDPTTRPPSSSSCSLAPCPRWRLAPWSKCSASCGEGVKERLVECVVEHEKSTACDTGTKPVDRASCSLGQCPHWKMGEWTECSVTCGSGIKIRKTECVSGVNASCDQKTKPLVTEKCDLGRCPRWHTGRWTGCSRTCGKGIKRRAVGCFSMITRKQISNEACEPRLRPASQLECTVKECIPEARWRKGKWGKCSVYCGIGDKSREVWCSTKAGKRVPDEFCAGEHKPRMTRSCNKNRRCGEWEIGVWTECSKTCGDGTKHRPIRCLHQLDYKDETYCNSRKRPAQQQPCNKRACPRLPSNYQWQTSTWRECSSSCGYGRKSRDIWCVDLSRRKVSDVLCNPASKPESSAACYGSKCPSKWKHGDWSPCSTTCSLGYQYRAVECVGNTECDKRTKPPVWRPCNRGECGSFLLWRVGKWSKCSVTCGHGIMRRLVKCFARNGSFVDDSFCTTPLSSKPEGTRVCQMKACPPKTCKDIQLISGLQNDGEQTLDIQGRTLQVYCHAMMSQEPKEYVTLRTGPTSNFAEIYPKRLRNARQCPRNGSHFEKCDCEDEDYQQSGGSYFSKIRIDLSAMKIIPEDKQFASTRGLNPPAYGTAGDCYSAQGRCPQGRFSINLKETGIRLTSKVMWGSTGQTYSQIIYRYPEGQQVIGKCGGRCGICTPENDVGLKIELVEDVS